MDALHAETSDGLAKKIFFVTLSILAGYVLSVIFFVL